VANSFFISVPETFDFKHCLSYLWRSPREVLHVCNGKEVTKLIRGKDRNILFRVTNTQKRLQVSVLNTSLTKDIKAAVESYVREWFDLDTDLEPFYALASRDRHLKDLVKEYYGYRIVGQPDLFESLVWAVIGQQINLAFAYTLKQRLVEKFGEQITIDGTTYYLFPEPRALMTFSHYSFHVKKPDILSALPNPLRLAKSLGRNWKQCLLMKEWERYLPSKGSERGLPTTY
jgi:DNA-3-methyladenine glycosylase II